MKAHHYTSRLIWTGNTGDGTGSYTSYEREYRILIGGKPDLEGSADAMFRGDAERYNPEDLFLAAISSCHLLSYLALCARNGIRVVAYEDDADGSLELDAGGGGKFTSVMLRPRVTIDAADKRDLAIQLHADAHRLCFIANSCSVPITHEASVLVSDTFR